MRNLKTRFLHVHFFMAFDRNDFFKSQSFLVETFLKKIGSGHFWQLYRHKRITGQDHICLSPSKTIKWKSKIKKWHVRLTLSKFETVIWVLVNLFCIKQYVLGKWSNAMFSYRSRAVTKTTTVIFFFTTLHFLWEDFYPKRPNFEQWDLSF